jgi:hypothetical protein
MEFKTMVQLPGEATCDKSQFQDLQYEYVPFPSGRLQTYQIIGTMCSTVSK